MHAITERTAFAAEEFRREIQPAGQPVVYRGLVRDWPAVAAARQSDRAFCDYLRRFDRGFELNTAFGPPSTRGRIFYNEDLSGLNCRMLQSPLSASLDYLLEHAGDDPPPALALQSVIINRFLPGLEHETVLPAGLVPAGVDGRIWLGNRVVVAAHFDPSENLAACIAGRRRFTLFPPEQVANLYVGPFELTPAGATISMVDFEAPDRERFPRFAAAEAAAFTAELGPGDALYVPYLWWHHVRSLDAVNGLVNFWWARGRGGGGDPRNVLLHAMLAIRSLPAEYRAGWQALFGHYVYGADAGEAGAHLPERRRGILGEPGEDELRRLRLALSRALGRD